MPPPHRSEELQFEGCNFFRFRIAYSLLSGRPIVIDNIRSEDDNPGLKEHETLLLKLLNDISNGTQTEISRTGTRLRFTPGVLLGGEASLNCGLTRCISFYLETLLLISPFCKKPLRVKLEGVTNAPGEISVEAIRTAWLPVYTKFVLNDEDLDIKIVNRGLLPEGGGKVIFTAPIVKKLRPVQRDKVGKVCKIRGTAWVTKVSPSLAHRLIDGAKQALRGYITDVYITVDQRKGVHGGNSPGFGVVLWAETTEGVVYHGEAMSKPRGSAAVPGLPEEVGSEGALRLLEQIYLGGCTDGSAQALAATFMTLGEKDVNRFLLGDLSLYSVAALRHLKTFFGMIFKMEDWERLRKMEEKKKAIEKVEKEEVRKEGEETEKKEEEEERDPDEMRLGSKNKVLLTGVGVGFSNLNKLAL
ncbi:hypothetical protein PFISCL1PPCAC_24637 [Pristionchus fissidentatus]|uniref:RNA 3'-terminal phosphate cyclase-like protein n=1 Tax=Pristionchus fissidentatus TaxID=1538716 RepID=A0AAV5WRV6_9BILA|nr:hypothetical protein PFISCL1PPCAC_24637 [Pristionchus fissidentatus]